MLCKTPAIVLHTLKFSESSLIVQCYTEQFGRLSLMIRGIRKAHGSNRMALLQPLSILDMEINYRAKNDIHYLKEFRLSDPSTPPGQGALRNMMTLFLAEVLYKTVREEEPNPKLFEFLLYNCRYLSTIQEGLPNFHLYFLVHLTKFLGFYPVNNRDNDHIYFDPVAGAFSTTINQMVPSMIPADSFLLHTLLNLPPDQLSTVSVSGEQRTHFLDEILRYYRIHLEGMGIIQSHTMFRDLLHSGSVR